jgi:hypothetical protein
MGCFPKMLLKMFRRQLPILAQGCFRWKLPYRFQPTAIWIKISAAAIGTNLAIISHAYLSVVISCAGEDARFGRENAFLCLRPFQ